MILGKEIITISEPMKLSNGAVINRFSHVLAGADIGENVMIGEHCYIGKDAQIGARSRVQNHNNIWDGVRIGSGVFIGPNCTLTNHFDPRDRGKVQFKPDMTRIDTNATICAGACIVAPCNIGKNAMVAAGSTVLRDVEENEFVCGVVK
jgi:UDP-2-acetamido-3-amino-2,3-dideoxy-glucuronate N-acetyltransferase